MHGPSRPSGVAAGFMMGLLEVIAGVLSGQSALLPLRLGEKPER
jgi:hypothetical protein